MTLLCSNRALRHAQCGDKARSRRLCGWHASVSTHSAGILPAPGFFATLRMTPGWCLASRGELRSAWHETVVPGSRRAA